MRKTKDSDEFMSPPCIMALTKKVLGDVFFDPYGHPLQLVKTRTMHSIDTGNQPWPTSGPIYVNPPFSQSNEQVPRVASWMSKYKIDCMMLCLAAPGTNYWREAIWSPTGPQRIVWMPRLSFWRVDTREELEILTNTATGAALTEKQASRRVVDHTGSDGVDRKWVKNPNYGKLQPTKQSISRDLALMLWSTNPVVIARFVREVTAYAKEANPKAAPIGISLGGGPQP